MRAKLEKPSEAGTEGPTPNPLWCLEDNSQKVWGCTEIAVPMPKRCCGGFSSADYYTETDMAQSDL